MDGMGMGRGADTVGGFAIGCSGRAPEGGRSPGGGVTMISGSS